MEESNNSEEVPKEPETKKSNKKIKLTKPTIISIAILGFLLVAGVATAAYTQVVLNNPDRIWDDALINTKSGIDEVAVLLDETPMSGGKITGSISLESPIVADLTLEGEWLEEELQLTSETNVAGSTLNSELIAVNNEESEKSELFLRINGLDRLSVFSELFVPGSKPLLEQANNTWYKLQADEIEELSQLPTGLDVENITKNDYRQEIDKINSLLDSYIYNPDEAQNVISYSPVGREDFNGNDSYKYKITMNESRSQDLLDEISSLLSESSLAIPDDTEKTEESINLDSILEANSSKLEVEVWVDMNLRYFRNARFYMNQSDQQGFIDIGLDYDGGDEMPFYISIVSEENKDNTMNILLSATFNKISKVTALGLNITAKSNQQPINAKANLSFIPGETTIDVEPPENYESFESLIENISLLNIFGSNTSTYSIEENTLILDDVEL